MSSLAFAPPLDPNTAIQSIAESCTALKLENPVLRGVFYTDGGCYPTPRGIGSYGVHGYIYVLEQPKTGYGLKGFVPRNNGYVESNLNNKHLEAVTVVQYIDIVGNISPPSTNNEAELLGLINAFNLAMDLKLKYAFFLLDSEYVLKEVRGNIQNRAKGGWRRDDGQSMANVERWKELYHLWVKIQDAMEIQFGWVKGHSGELGNELADKWCIAGRHAGLNGHLDFNKVILSSPKKYWQPDNDYNTFLSESYWYFNADVQQEYNGKPLYLMGNHGKDPRDLGVPKAESSMCVVSLPEKDKVLERVRTKICESDEDTGTVYIGVLGTIMRPNSHHMLLTHGSEFTRIDGNTLIDHEKRVLVNVSNPTFQAFNALDVLSQLTNTFIDFFDNHLQKGYVVKDITDLLYEGKAVKNKQEVKLKLSNDDVTALEIEADYRSVIHEKDRSAKIVLTAGIDLPKRNTLAAIAAPSTKIYLVTWPETSLSFDAFRYATLISSEMGNGIWAGVYSNIRIVL